MAGSWWMFGGTQCIPSIQSLLQVRRHSAEQLYLQLLVAEVEEEGAGEEAGADGMGGDAGSEGVLRLAAEAHEQALDLLLSTPWDGPLEGARGARNALAALLGLEVRSRLVGAAGGVATGVAALRVRADENASYQSLLDDAARGGGY